MRAGRYRFEGIGVLRWRGVPSAGVGVDLEAACGGGGVLPRRGGGVLPDRAGFFIQLCFNYHIINAAIHPQLINQINNRS